jgi:non-ribosomal peptide synthetase component F
MHPQSPSERLRWAGLALRGIAHEAASLRDQLRARAALLPELRAAERALPELLLAQLDRIEGRLAGREAPARGRGTPAAAGQRVDGAGAGPLAARR